MAQRRRSGGSRRNGAAVHGLGAQLFRRPADGPTRPASLIQAQRDYFGAHTFERTDAPRGEFFHNDWTGRGGKTSSGSYNV